MGKLSVYIHIPFCKQKCRYCDFLSAPAGEQIRNQYVQALCGEIEAEGKHYRNYQVETVFLGGGTPSLLSGEQIQKMMDCLRRAYQVSPDAEISMEMNPGTVTARKLAAYKKAGINRVSLGLQSANNNELAMLGRIHTWEMFLESYRLCREAGFSNINIDLMSALPGQTRESYLYSLMQVTALEPEHISAYSLIIEEGTPFYQQYLDSPLLPDEETERGMYEDTKKYLAKEGYVHYEISNFAKQGKACRHNCTYWERGDYVGFGLGAASMVNNKRWSNVTDVSEYIKLPAGEKKRNVQSLSEAEQMEETMFLGLRMMQGVSKEKFRTCFGVEPEQVYGEVIEKHIRNGLLVMGDTIYLTEKGIDVSNYVMSDFLFEK